MCGFDNALLWLESVNKVPLQCLNVGDGIGGLQM